MTERSLWAGIEQMTKGNALHEIGRAVQQVAEGPASSVVREYVGHAIGTAMHEQPQVPNYWPGNRGPTLKTGNVFAVEPMVNVGSPETVLLEDHWSVVTADGSLSAHFEHSIAVTADGPEADAPLTPEALIRGAPPGPRCAFPTAGLGIRRETAPACRRRKVARGPAASPTGKPAGRVEFPSGCGKLFCWP